MFGAGLLESVYERLLAVELVRRGHEVQRQKDISFVYENVRFDNAFRIDLLVDGKVIVELKATAQMLPVYAKQLKTYLALTGLNVGLLLNFGMYTMKEGVKRVVNDFDENNVRVYSDPLSFSSDALLSATELIGSSELVSPSADDSLSSQDLCVSASPRETLEGPLTQRRGDAEVRVRRENINWMGA